MQGRIKTKLDRMLLFILKLIMFLALRATKRLKTPIPPMRVIIDNHLFSSSLICTYVLFSSFSVFYSLFSFLVLTFLALEVKPLTPALRCDS